MRLLLKGGRVVDPSIGVDNVANVIVVDDSIASVELGDVGESGFDAVLDASGCVVVPGLIDMHVHLREPGYEDKETIETGTRSAVAGGVTTVAAMPNTNPVVDSKMGVEFVRATAERRGYCSVEVIGAITKGQKGEELAEIGDLVDAGVVAISDDGHTVMNAEIMRRAMQYVSMYDIPIISHCEDENLAAGGSMNEGYNSTRLGLKGVSRLAEEIIVARDVLMAEVLKCRLHVAHVSTRGSVDIIRRAKSRGVRVTCEVAPHHLALTDEEMGRFDANFKMSPPLRTEDDVEALIQGLCDGTIDAIATDHAPHTPEEKAVELDYAPNGVIGLESSLTVILTTLVKKGRLSLGEMVTKMSSSPAAILGLSDRGSLRPGKAADITVIDIEAPRTIDPSTFVSKARNCPFAGFEGYGIVRHVVSRGRIRVFDGRLL